jgi:hypothetical protein
MSRKIPKRKIGAESRWFKHPAMGTGVIVGVGVIAAGLVYPFAGLGGSIATIAGAALIAWHFSLPKD